MGKLFDGDAMAKNSRSQLPFKRTVSNGEGGRSVTFFSMSG
jgi:hypothetical protein